MRRILCDYPFGKVKVEGAVSISLDCVSSLGLYLHRTCQEFNLGMNLKVRRCSLWTNVCPKEQYGVSLHTGGHHLKYPCVIILVSNLLVLTRTPLSWLRTPVHNITHILIKTLLGKNYAVASCLEGHYPGYGINYLL